MSTFDRIPPRTSYKSSYASVVCNVPLSSSRIFNDGQFTMHIPGSLTSRFRYSTILEKIQPLEEELHEAVAALGKSQDRYRAISPNNPSFLRLEIIQRTHLLFIRFSLASFEHRRKCLSVNFLNIFGIEKTNQGEHAQRRHRIRQTCRMNNYVVFNWRIVA